VPTQFVGAPATVVERLATLACVTGADELLVTTITTDHADRVRSPNYWLRPGRSTPPGRLIPLIPLRENR
jgi:hypothetical protein